MPRRRLSSRRVSRRRVSSRRALAVSLAAASMVLLSACGVSLQSSAESIPPDVLPDPVIVTPTPTPASTSSASPSSSASSSETATDETTARLRLWFVQENGLVAVESSLPVDSNPDYVMQALVVGPTSVQAAQGLRTIASDPLTGQPLAIIATPAAGAPATPDPDVDPALTDPVTVQLNQAFSALPPAEQVLLLGQVVLSLTGAGESAVSFVDESGAPVAVPLPDGRVLDTPARARDYGPLIYRP